MFLSSLYYKLESPNTDTGISIGTDTGMNQQHKQILKNYNRTWPKWVLIQVWYVPFFTLL